MTDGITRINRPGAVLDLAALARLLVTDARSRIVRRTSAGVDMHDKAFASYSQSYREGKMALGRNSTPDLTLTGGMLKATQVRELRVVNGSWFMSVAPGPGASQRLRVPPPWISSDPKALARWLSGPRFSTAPSTAHNRVGAWLHFGTPKMKPRPWLGLSPKDLQAIRAMMQSRQGLWRLA
jgi:hypothetical protein